MKDRYRAVFARGGTSKALIFRREDLPAERAAWDGIFLRAMGSPDPYGRQLNGMGGGISSLSKVCVVGPASRPDADVDFTFAQVQIREARVDYRGNCGNMSSAIGPFAIEEGLVAAPDGEATVRIHNTNTGKLIQATFPVAGGRVVPHGDVAIPGVSGSGTPVRLDFLEPGGASTGRLLPTGNVVDTIDGVEMSLVDAANACVFIAAEALGLRGTELPDAIDGRPELLARLGDLREQAAIAMGIASSLEHARNVRMIPLIGFVSAPQESATLGTGTIPAPEADLLVRMISNGQPHRALPLTGALCLAVAAQLPGSIPNRVLRKGASGALRFAMPSGVITVAAGVEARSEGWYAAYGSIYRTTRRLFAGDVYL